MDTRLVELYEAIYECAMGLPEAYEELPWGHPAIKVRKKVFVFLSTLDEEYIGFSVKLPESAAAALELPNVTETGYGLGKSGWVSVKIASTLDLDLDTAKSWILESYRAIAPKKLSALLPTD